MTTARDPLLKVGTFGTHIIDNPAGTFSFVGTVPTALGEQAFATYDEALAAFRDWFRAMPADAQREHVGNLRNDVFAYVLTA